MSFTPGFAPDAKSQWHELDAESQEAVLDVLDRLALNPPSNGEYVVDEVREQGGIAYYVFVHVLVQREINSVTILGVGHTTRPMD